MSSLLIGSDRFCRNVCRNLASGSVAMLSGIPRFSCENSACRGHNDEKVGLSPRNHACNAITNKDFIDLHLYYCVINSATFVSSFSFLPITSRPYCGHTWIRHQEKSIK